MFQKFCGKMVKIKEMSFLSTRGAVCFALNCRCPDIIHNFFVLVQIFTRRNVMHEKMLDLGDPMLGESISFLHLQMNHMKWSAKKC